MKETTNFLSEIYFNQGMFQDYIDCKQRFYLRYIKQLAWPAIKAEPVLENERRMMLGDQFHKAVHRLLIGIPAQEIEKLINDPDLAAWWNNFILFWEGHLSSTIFQPDVQYLPELSINCSLGNARLAAKFDLLVLGPNNRVLIYDWKTSLKKAPRNWLAMRMQTRLYQFISMTVIEKLLPGGKIAPHQVEMVYWFAGFPGQEERFVYSKRQFEQDTAFFSRIIDEIPQMGENDFVLTTNLKFCRYCNYRSFCERGRKAGSIWDDEEETLVQDEQELFTGFNEIPEITPLL